MHTFDKKGENRKYDLYLFQIECKLNGFYFLISQNLQEQLIKILHRIEKKTFWRSSY